MWLSACSFYGDGRWWSTAGSYYLWMEKQAFYDEAFSSCDHNFPGPDFAVLEPQGLHADYFLHLCKTVLLSDTVYVERLKRHLCSIQKRSPNKRFIWANSAKSFAEKAFPGQKWSVFLRKWQKIQKMLLLILVSWPLLFCFESAWFLSLFSGPLWLFCR